MRVMKVSAGWKLVFCVSVLSTIMTNLKVVSHVNVERDIM